MCHRYYLFSMYHEYSPFCCDIPLLQFLVSPSLLFSSANTEDLPRLVTVPSNTSGRDLLTRPRGDGRAFFGAGLLHADGLVEFTPDVIYTHWRRNPTGKSLQTSTFLEQIF